MTVGIQFLNRLEVVKTIDCHRIVHQNEKNKPDFIFRKMAYLLGPNHRMERLFLIASSFRSCIQKYCFCASVESNMGTAFFRDKCVLFFCLRVYFVILLPFTRMKVRRGMCVVSTVWGRGACFCFNTLSRMRGVVIHLVALETPPQMGMIAHSQTDNSTLPV